jgi:hypothetical protein
MRRFFLLLIPFLASCATTHHERMPASENFTFLKCTPSHVETGTNKKEIKNAFTNHFVDEEFLKQEGRKPEPAEIIFVHLLDIDPQKTFLPIYTNGTNTPLGDWFDYKNYTFGFKGGYSPDLKTYQITLSRIQRPKWYNSLLGVSVPAQYSQTFTIPVPFEQKKFSFSTSEDSEAPVHLLLECEGKTGTPKDQ